VSEPQDPVFFVDRALGKRHVPDALRALGCRVEIHDDHFEAAALDADWIPVVAQNGWLILTKDEKIAYRVLERQAVAQYGARMFILVSGSLPGPKMARAFQDGLNSMKQFVRNHQAPFMAKVYKSGEVRVWKSREDLTDDIV